MRKLGLSSKVRPFTCHVCKALPGFDPQHLHTTHIILLPGAVAHIHLSRLGQQEAGMTLKPS